MNLQSIRESLLEKRKEIDDALAALDVVERINVRDAGERVGDGKRAPRRKAPKAGRKARAAAKTAGEPADGPKAKILARLRERSPRAPGELAQACGLNSSSALAYHLKPLLKARQVAAIGKGSARQYTLPGKTPAKEAPRAR